jgi:amino acid transporter
LKIGKWTTDTGGFATYAAGLLLIGLGVAVWALDGPATPLRPAPAWDWEKLNFWSQIAFAFGGLELGAVMGGEVRNPKTTIPRAAWISGSAIAGFYILGTLAILAVLPPDRVNILTGLVQAGTQSSTRVGLPWIAPLLAVLITLGVTGQLGAWLSGSARIPFVIGLDRYFPPEFARLHPRWQTPHVAILVQGAACTLFLVVMQLGENLRVGYQLLVDMTVITYFIPFLYMFLSAARHGRKLSGTCGLLVTAAGIVFSLVPPAGVGAAWLFELKVAGGCIVLIAAARIAFQRGRRALAQP